MEHIYKCEHKKLKKNLKRIEVLSQTQEGMKKLERENIKDSKRAMRLEKIYYIIDNIGESFVRLLIISFILISLIPFLGLLIFQLFTLTIGPLLSWLVSLLLLWLYPNS